MSESIKGSSSYGSITLPLPPPPPSTVGNEETLSNIPILAAAFSSALATGGPTYAFGLYGATLKATLHLTQSDLETLSSATFCAGLVSWIPGLCVDRLGCRDSMIMGGCAMSLGLFLYWVVARQLILISTAWLVPVLCILGIVIFMSNSLVVGSLFKSIVLSCGLGSKGSAVGAAKGYMGLGAGVYSCLFDAFRRLNESDLDFLPMAATLSVIAIAFPAFLWLPPNHRAKTIDVSTPLHYRIVFIGLFLLAVLVIGTSALFMFKPLPENVNEEYPESDGDHPHIERAMLVLLAWFGPILALFCLPKAEPTCLSIRKSKRTDEHLLAGVEEETLESPPEVVVEQLVLTEVLQTAPAWLLCWACTIIVGSGTMVTNNIGQMVEAIRLPKRAASACLALFSVAQAAARVATGTISESALTWNFGIQKGVPRPAFLMLSCLSGFIGHLVLSLTSGRESFVVSIILIGFSFGMVWPLMVLIVGDCWGTTHHGANYMFYDGFTSAIGTLVISKYITQTVYEQKLQDTDETTCYGVECFQTTHFVVAVLCLTSLLASIGVLVMTKYAYGQSAHHEEFAKLYGSPYLGTPQKRDVWLTTD